VIGHFQAVPGLDRHQQLRRFGRPRLGRREQGFQAALQLEAGGPDLDLQQVAQGGAVRLHLVASVRAARAAAQALHPCSLSSRPRRGGRAPAAPAATRPPSPPRGG
jgi:hypothetical protein